MPIDAAAYTPLKERGFLFHLVHFEQDLPWILRDGLLSRGVLSKARSQRDLPSRPGHVYLLTNKDGAASDAGFGDRKPQIAVNVDALDPALLDSDEDTIGAHLRVMPARVASLPGASNVRWRADNEPTAWWAEKYHHIIDSPRWVSVSIAHDRVAYRGPIPPSALNVRPEIRAHWLVAENGDPWRPRKWSESMDYYVP